ncbi:alpha/beta fold hydrolase [Shimia sediminis]|uniref:alpha/beta fold hydrolase n=1 Tax=Shimia sediminis TaxID=2497945 RepID=UPI0013E0DCF1|nr:alpha/beta hydrolase [Shimia sediminis]
MRRTIPGPCPIYVEVRGRDTAPCIVLLLGLGMQLGEWPKDFLDELARDFRVICIENRDMGRSGRCGSDEEPLDERYDGNAPRLPYTLFDMRDDVMRVLQELDVCRFAVVGFSMGGMIAQLVAGQAGGRLTAFVQICSSAGEADAPIPPPALKRFKRISRGFETEAEMLEWFEEDLIWCAAPSKMTRAEAVEVAEAMQISGFTTGGYTRQLAAIRFSGDRTDYLRRIAAPSLVIGADQDRCLASESSRRAHALIPGSKLRMFDGVGHSLDEKMLGHLTNWLFATIPGALPTTQATY